MPTDASAGWVLRIHQAQTHALGGWDHLAEVIAMARADGVSWAAIGQALGISRQAAWSQWAWRMPEAAHR